MAISTTYLVTFDWINAKKQMENVPFWNKNDLTNIGEMNKTTLNNPEHTLSSASNRSTKTHERYFGEASTASVNPF